MVVVVVVCVVSVTGHHVHCHQARRLAAGIPVARGTQHSRQVHTRLLQRHPAHTQTQGGQRLGAPRSRPCRVFSPGRLQRVAFCPRKVASLSPHRSPLHTAWFVDLSVLVCWCSCPQPEDAAFKSNILPSFCMPSPAPTQAPRYIASSTKTLDLQNSPKMAKM